MNRMKEGHRNTQNGQGNLSDLFEDNHKLPLPIIPMRVERPTSALGYSGIMQSINIGPNGQTTKLLPDYNFQSLFRKKSHLRLARNKKKQESKGGVRGINGKQQGQKQARHIKKGHWTGEENKLYHWFLELHNRHFILKHLRRTDKIFKSMASFIGTRQAEQCRSHHQKMQKKYHSFYQIILKLRAQFYSSTGSQQLRADLQDNGYALKQDQLISETQLKNGSQKTESAQMVGNPQSGEEQLQKLQESGSASQQNLMGQNYESGFNFKLYEG